MPRPFLTARWSNLIIASYAVDPAMLTPRLIGGLTLDTRDARTFVSLVAFQFLDTRVFGIPWPGLRHFPEINLRFYVRRAQDDRAGTPGESGCGGRRGVMFIREHAPGRIVSGVARRVYNEPYTRAPMTMRVQQTPSRIEALYSIRVNGREHRIAAAGRKPALTPPEAGAEHWFKEHQWGYGRTRDSRLLEYEVTHPLWSIYPIEAWSIDLDWSALYGPEWSPLQDAEPESVLFAAGSAVEVFTAHRH